MERAEPPTLGMIEARDVAKVQKEKKKERKKRRKEKGKEKKRRRKRKKGEV